MSNRQACAGSVLMALAVAATAVGGETDWPQWRGPDLNGISSATDLPTTWSLESGVIWKTDLPAWSGGTPIIWGDRIFITSPSAPDTTTIAEEPPAEGRRGRRGRRGSGRNPGGNDLLLLCVSRSTGDIMWRHTLDQGNELHRKGNNSSPSPVTDGTHVWVVTGTGSVTALDMDGQQVWEQNLQERYGRFGLNWGYASSPLLYKDLLIVEVLHGFKTDDPSYIVAFDTATGAVRWHQERPTDAPMESPDAYTTPIVATVDGTEHIVVTGGDVVTGHDPATGAELWRMNGLNPQASPMYRIVASPVFADGIVYAPTRVKPLLAIRPTGSGTLSAEHLAWSWNQAGSPDVPTPICDGKRFYMVNDAGMVTCLNAKTGEAIWGPERTIRGTVSSSPILADGKLYWTTEEAITVVVNATDEFKLLASNELDGSYTLSSPVAAGNQLFIRTGDALYCIGQAASAPGVPASQAPLSGASR